MTAMVQARRKAMPPIFRRKIDPAAPFIRAVGLPSRPAMTGAPR